MENKQIGILGWKITDNSFGCTLPYITYANMFGDVRIIGLHEPIHSDLDLLIVPGGADINPMRYSQMPGYYTSKPDPIKEYQDLVILPSYIEEGVPIFGICRGMQAIAVHFGAMLVQEMYHETNTDEDGRAKEVHPIKVVVDDITKSSSLKVNSLHHQCVSMKNFPDCLEVVAEYAGKMKTSCIEAIRHRTLPIYGVQYHPEELVNDSLGDEILWKLLNYEFKFEEAKIEEVLSEV